MTMPLELPAQSQQQSQRQDQVVTVNLNSSSDPELERRIFTQVHSAGRQLGNLAALVQLLLDAQRSAPGFASSDKDKETIAAFEAMQADIAREKQRRDPEILIERLEALRSTDPKTFAAIRNGLRDWLDKETS
jgi:hypothetical protein